MPNSVLQLCYTKVYEDYGNCVHFSKILWRSLCEVFGVVNEPASDFCLLISSMFVWLDFKHLLVVSLLISYNSGGK